MTIWDSNSSNTTLTSFVERQVTYEGNAVGHVRHSPARKQGLEAEDSFIGELIESFAIDTYLRV